MRHAGAVAIMVACWLPALAWGHSFQPERTLIVQVDGKGLALFWSFQVQGSRAEALMASHDFDRDGRFSLAEQTTVALALLSKAQAGVSLTWQGRALPKGTLTPRLQTDGSSVRALGLVEYGPGEQATPIGNHNLTVTVAEVAPLGLEVRAASPCQIVSQQGGHEHAQHGLMLLPGMTVTVTLACVDSAVAPGL